MDQYAKSRACKVMLLVVDALCKQGEQVLSEQKMASAQDIMSMSTKLAEVVNTQPSSRI